MGKKPLFEDEIKVRIPKDIKERLEKIAARKRTSLSEIARQAVLFYCDENTESNTPDPSWDAIKDAVKKKDAMRRKRQKAEGENN